MVSLLVPLPVVKPVEETVATHPPEPVEMPVDTVTGPRLPLTCDDPAATVPRLAFAGTLMVSPVRLAAWLTRGPGSSTSPAARARLAAVRTLGCYEPVPGSGALCPADTRAAQRRALPC